MKKVTKNGTVIRHECYLYRSYLQITTLDMFNGRNMLRVEMGYGENRVFSGRLL